MNERFDYKIAQTNIKGMGLVVNSKKYNDNDVDMLNRLGREGWDCYTVETGQLPVLNYMKRKI